MTTTPAASDAERPVQQAPETPASTLPLKPRLHWRVVVRTQGKHDQSRPSRPLAWHLVSCTATERSEAHCPEGRRLVSAGDDPDGHCLLDGVCPRCTWLESKVAP